MKPRDSGAVLNALVKTGRFIPLNGVEDICKSTNFQVRDIACIAWCLSSLRLDYPVNTLVSMFMQKTAEAKGVDFAQMSVAVAAEADLKTAAEFLFQLRALVERGSLQMSNVDLVVLSSSLYTLSNRLLSCCVNRKHGCDRQVHDRVFIARNSMQR